jgi:alcohol dehydrogenase class IV
MTSEYTGRAAERGGVGKETEVQRARAELVAALSELEDKVNVPKRIKRFRAAEPRKFLAAASAVGTVAAGIVALGVVVIARRR